MSTAQFSSAVSTRELLTDFFNAGVTAVSGKQAVIRALQQDAAFQSDFIVAVGKAASGMCLGALQGLTQSCPALVVTKYDHVDPAVKDNPSVTVV